MTAQFDDTKQVATYELASIGSRFVANIIDGIILGILGFIIGVPLNIVDDTGVLSSIAGLIIGFVYVFHFWTNDNGQTPGKKAMDIRIIKTDGGPIRGSDATLRWVGYWISSIVLLLGYIWALFDDHNQAWHDKIADTYVVKAERKKKHVTI